jgi:3-oxoadipate enol-lactonase
LSPHFRCIAFDFRGYGASIPLTRSNSVSLMADDAAALCRALGVEHAYIVGLSMGAGVAQGQCLRHPSLVDGLVLAGPLQIHVVPGAMPKLTIDLLRPLLIASFSPAFQQQHPDMVARLVDEYLRTSLDTLQHISFHDLPMEPGRTSAPALVVTGEHDVAAPPIASLRLVEKLPNATYMELSGTGHVMNIEAPEAFTAAIVDFIDAHPRTRAGTPARPDEGEESV